METIPTLRVLWETLRHLRFRQIEYQIIRRLLPASKPRPLALRWLKTYPRILRDKNRKRSFFSGGKTFRFNTESREFTGWNDPQAGKLWLYNLHYMTWLFDLEEDRDKWIRKWVHENPPTQGIGWEPYPLSLRLSNWCKHYSLTGKQPDPEVLASMGVQVSRLLSTLEFHLDANHLLENVLALAFAGAYLDVEDPATDKIRGRIRNLIEGELSEQFLSDGGHYERSPMYHSILLERVLDLLNFGPGLKGPFGEFDGQLRVIAVRGVEWLDIMSVEGRFALFNDSAYDMAPDPDLLIEYGRLLLDFRSRPEAIKALPDSGYYRAEMGDWILIFDGGILGPDHQPGHAQGDMLSFCLWLENQPLIVHPGNFEYVRGEMRDYCRATASHNTLVVEGGEQAEWWASHRVGWRGHPQDVSAGMDPEGAINLRGSHDGFSRLSGSPHHTREIKILPDSISILDQVSGNSKRLSRIYFHFHPDCKVDLCAGGIHIRDSHGNEIEMTSTHTMKIESGWHCPEFGLRQSNSVVVVEGLGNEYRTVFRRNPFSPR